MCEGQVKLEKGCKGDLKKEKFGRVTIERQIATD
jgi:hypothetical protein